QAPGRGGGGNRINSAKAMVGEPDQGVPDIFGRGAATPPGGAATPVPAGAAAPAAPLGAAGGGPGAVTSVYALASDGMLHQLSVQTGKDVVMMPLKMLPPNANASGLLLVDNVLYTTTTNECGGAPNGVWAVDLNSSDKTIASWKTNGPNIAGSAGLTVGTDGTIYVATADGSTSSSSYANSVVALEPNGLKLRDYFKQPKGILSPSPLVSQKREKDLIATAGKDGRLYILNSTSLGGTDHQTPISATTLTTNRGDFAPSALAAWQDADGTRWILVPTSSTIVAFKLVEQNGIPTLQQHS